jgi:hypothetical protein
MTRLIQPPDPIDVECDADGSPLHITWRGQQHTVAHIANSWRADAEWWRARQWRQYLKVTTNTGLLITIYHDLGSGAWYIQRLYD